MPFRTPAFFRRREEPAAGAQAQPAAPAQRLAGGDDAMLDAAPLPPPHAGGQAGAGRGDCDAHAAALAADVLPDKQAIGSALGGLGAPPLFPLLPHEELLSDEERAISLQGFGAFGCVPGAGRRQVCRTGLVQGSCCCSRRVRLPRHAAASTTTAAHAWWCHAARARCVALRRGVTRRCGGGNRGER